MLLAAGEIIWKQHFLSEFGILLDNPTPWQAYNGSVIPIATNPIFQECTKHIEAKYLSM